MVKLDEFVRAAKAQGATDEFVVDLLRQHGWPERAVYEALGRIYVESTGMILPHPPNTLEAAREAFFHLLAFGTLAAWTYAIGYLWFELIENWLPDPAMGLRAPDLRQISWYIAAIIIAFPVFAFANGYTLRDRGANPEKVASSALRWITNLGLLLNAAVFIGVLVTFLAFFFQGELTSRFVSKSLVLLLLTGGVFAYYVPGLSTQQGLPTYAWHRRFAWAAGAMIALTLGVGFWTTGPPSVQRARAEDRRRIEDLHQLTTVLQDRWKNSRSLPATLQQISQVNTQFRLSDPFSARPYEYFPGQDGSYQICAVFMVASLTDSRRSDWAHPQGRHCFARNAEQDYHWPLFE